MQILLRVGVRTSYLADNYSRSGGIAQEFGWHVQFVCRLQDHIQCFSEGAEEVGDELRAPVGCDMGWNSMLREYVQ
jgi:hypothetical protein